MSRKSFTEQYKIGMVITVAVGYLFTEGYWKRHHDYKCTIEKVTSTSITAGYIDDLKTKIEVTKRNTDSGYMFIK